MLLGIHESLLSSTYYYLVCLSFYKRNATYLFLFYLCIASMSCLMYLNHSYTYPFPIKCPCTYLYTYTLLFTYMFPFYITCIPYILIRNTSMHVYDHIQLSLKPFHTCIHLVSHSCSFTFTHL